MFCNDKFASTEEMRVHLMMCGNRTDQCPKCKKFIRRAVFAYHYENNCADLDDIDNDRVGDTSVAASKQQANNSSQSFTRPTTSPERHITRMDVDLSIQPNRESSTLHRSNSGMF